MSYTKIFLKAPTSCGLTNVDLNLPNTYPSMNYPTDSELHIIKTWPHTKGYVALLAYVQSLWWHPEYFKIQTHYRYRIATAGWSGNESLIRALQENSGFWMMCWVCSKRGGLYNFHIPRGMRIT